MTRKRFLKMFNTYDDYELNKYVLMRVPHVIYIRDSKKTIFQPKTTDGNIVVSISDGDLFIHNEVVISDGDLELVGYNVFLESNDNKKFNLIIK